MAIVTMPGATIFVKFYQYYGTRGSLARFIEELVPAVSQMMPEVRFVYATPRAPRALASKDQHLPTGFKAGASYAGNLIRFLSSEISLRARICGAARDGRSIVLWELSQWLTSPCLGERTITTVHEPMPPSAPRSRMVEMYYRRGVIPLLRRKRLCVAVSESARHTLAQCGIERTACVQNWVAEPFLRQSRMRARERDAPILFVGTLAPVKNLSLLLQLYRIRDIKRSLLCVVPGFDAEPLRQRLESANLSSKVMVLWDQVDDQMVKTYQRAFALIVPSVNEGFGLPAAEAMAQGLPVVATDIPVMREVCGEGATYFRGGDAGQLYDRLRSLEDPCLWCSLSDAGRQRAERFRLSHTVSLYRDALEGLL